eukprot:6200160-Pleurochrysis_carterae.AAC.7
MSRAASRHSKASVASTAVLAARVAVLMQSPRCVKWAATNSTAAGVIIIPTHVVGVRCATNCSEVLPPPGD